MYSMCCWGRVSKSVAATCIVKEQTCVDLMYSIHTVVCSSVADPERFDADPDPDPTFQADADPDPNPFTWVRNFFS